MADLNVGKLTFDLTVDDSAFQVGMKRSELAAASTAAKTSASIGKVGDSAETAGKQITGMSSATSKAVLSMAALGAGMVAFNFIKDAIQSASDLNEALNLSTSIFKENSSAIQEWAKSGADAFGLSTTEAIQSAAGYANLFQNVGVGIDQATQQSRQLVEVSADMASAFNTTVPDAVQAISAGLRGEAEPLRRYGVMLDDVTLKAKAMEMGMYDGKGVLSQVAKAQAAYNIVLDKTATIQGDFQKTAEDPANATRILQANVENLKAALGQDLLPVMKEVLATTQGIVKWLGEHLDAVMALAKVTAVIGAIALAWKGVQKAIQMAQAAQLAFNRTPASGPGAMAGKIGAAAGVAGAAMGVAWSTVPTMIVDPLADNRLGKVASTESVISDWLKNGGAGLDTIGFFGDKMKGLGDEVAKVINPENTGAIEGWGRRFEDFWGSVAGNGGGEGRNRVLEQVANIDAAITQLISEGKVDEATALYNGFIAEVTKQPGVTAEQAKALLTTSNDAMSEYSRTTGEATTATKELSAAQAAAATATKAVKGSVTEAKDALKSMKEAVRTYKDALTSMADTAVGNIDPFGGDPTGKRKDTLSSDALLRRSAASREYMQQQAADIKALKRAGASQDTLSALYESEQANPGTLRRIVSEGVTKPFIKQLNADFAERSHLGDLIAQSMVMTEKQAMRSARQNYRTYTAAYLQAVISERQATAGLGDQAPGGWMGSLNADRQVGDVQALYGGVKSGDVTIGQMTVITRNPDRAIEEGLRYARSKRLNGRG